MKHEHVLIIRFSALGDVAMAVPVVYSLAQQYPHIRITVLSREFARPFFENLAPNVGFMAADIKHEYHGVKGLNTLYRRLTAKKFTAIADLHNVLRSGYLRMRFNLGRYHVAHVNKHRKGKRKLTATNKKVFKQQPTSFQNYAEVLAKLGYPINVKFRSIFPPEGGDLSQLPEAFRVKGSEEKWIGVAPFAAHEGKIYPLKLMEQVISQLAERYPKSKLFLFGGGQKELSVFEDWCMRYPQCQQASKELKSISKELILMSHLDVMISMDSGNMHMASLTGTPVVSVWGATHPYAGFMGWGQRMEDSVQIDLPCRPCSVYGNKPCLRNDYACMQNIAPEQIVAKVTNVITRGSQRS